MDLTISAALSLFTLLAVAVAVYYISRALKQPYTVLLVAAGIIIAGLISIPQIQPAFGFLDDAQLTPELLLFVFLPVLIFESGYSINIRRMVDSAWIISSLAIVALAIATAGIAATLTWALGLVGISVPFIVVLLFASVISATDPVGVLALFKTLGAPKRLSIIFEGESLFNDGTAVAIFVVVLGVLESGYHGGSTVTAGVATFILMVVLGIASGLVLAAVCGYAIRATRTNAFVSSTLLIISANLVFILAEIFNEAHLHVGAVAIEVSPIIATTVSALYLGNYWRHSLLPEVDQYVRHLVEHAAFVVNSLVFLMAGILLAEIAATLTSLIVPMVLAVVVVAIWRAISVYAVTTPLNLIHAGSRIPASWQILLSWGSLRGALALIVIMTLPDDLAVSGWTLESSPKQFLLAMTVATILFSTFVKAPTIEALMKRFNLTKPQPLAEVREADLAIYYLVAERARFRKHHPDGEYTHQVLTDLVDDLTARLHAAERHRQALADELGLPVFQSSTHVMALTVEVQKLRQLFVNQEISSNIYRELLGKIHLQLEAHVEGQPELVDPRARHDNKDIFEILAKIFHPKSGQSESTVSLYQRRRAEYLMASRAADVLTAMNEAHEHRIFIPDALDATITQIEALGADARQSARKLAQTHPDELSDEIARLAKRVRHQEGERVLADLSANGVISGFTIRDFKDLPE